MTDKELQEKVRTEIESIRPSEEARAQILKELTSDDVKNKRNINEGVMDKMDNDRNAENRGKIKVKTMGGVVAAAAVSVICVGTGMFLLNRQTAVNRDTQSDADVAAADSEAQNGTEENDEAIPNFAGYTVFEKFYGQSEIYRLSNGKFLVRTPLDYNDTVTEELVCSYCIYNGETNAVENVMNDVYGDLEVLKNGFSLNRTVTRTDYGVTEICSQYYDSDMNLVNSFTFDVSADGQSDSEEKITASAVSQDGSELFVKTTGRNTEENYNFISFYKVSSNAAADNFHSLFEIEFASNEHIDEIYPTEDGKGLFYSGNSWYVPGEETEEGDLAFGCFALDSETESSYSYCPTIYKSGDNKFVFERNGVMYIFSDEKSECTVLSPANGEDSAVAEQSFDFGNEEFGYVPQRIYMSESGKYIIAATYLDYNVFSDTLIAVYEIDGFKKIFEDTVNSRLWLDGKGSLIFDEQTGDLCAKCNDPLSSQAINVYCKNVFGGEYKNFNIAETSENDLLSLYVDSEESDAGVEADFSKVSTPYGYQSILNGTYCNMYNIVSTSVSDGENKLEICLKNDDKKQELIEFLESHGADMDMIVFGENTEPFVAVGGE